MQFTCNAVSTYLNHIRLFLFFIRWGEGLGWFIKYINLSCFHVGRKSLLYIRNINCEFIKYDAHVTCLVYYGFFLDRQFRGDVAILVFLKTMASYNPPILTPSLFTEVPVLSQESERSCICVLGILNLPISTIFLLNFWNFSDDVILFFFILL